MHSAQTPLQRSRFKSREKLRSLHQLSCTFRWPRVYNQKRLKTARFELLFKLFLRLRGVSNNQHLTNFLTVFKFIAVATLRTLA
jgi:hypothetical protein